jgi:hypothetical protein
MERHFEEPRYGIVEYERRKIDRTAEITCVVTEGKTTSENLADHNGNIGR